MNTNSRLIIASNRLPIAVSTEEDTVTVRPSTGGLVTAMEPVLSVSSGVWVGWCGLAGEPPGVMEAISSFSDQAGFDLIPVVLNENQTAGFYGGFSNAIVWPLFHDLQSLCNFEPSYWQMYREVSSVFASKIGETVAANDVVWVHDYHLMGVGSRLKQSGITNQCIFFLHIPFPSPDIFLKLPWRNEVLEDLLSYDLIGFQTSRDLKNFIDNYNLLYNQSIPYQAGRATVSIRNKQIVAGAFPIAIDFQEFDSQTQTPEIVERANKIRTDLQVEKLILSVDRLDYTKGIPYRIKAFRRLLEKYPEWRKRVVLTQIVVPSRSEVDQYQQLKSSIERLVSEVNGEFGEVGWTPIQHFYRTIAREELLALYLAADIGLVTPLKDGMNLVSKEFCVSHFDLRGRLILSEFAGAAEEIGAHSELVNPYDIEGVAETLFNVLNETPEEQQADMEQIRSILLQKDVFAWARSVLEAANIPGAATMLGYEEHETIWSKLWRKILFE